MNISAIIEIISALLKNLSGNEARQLLGKIMDFIESLNETDCQDCEKPVSRSRGPELAELKTKAILAREKIPAQDVEIGA